MPDVIIRVEGIGKKYRRGASGGPTTLRDSFARLLAMGGRAHPHLGGSEEFWAVKDVSFELSRGEVLGVVGANGSGKSTLLKILSRITRPTEGRAWIRGRVASLLEVGTGFHPELTGRENIFLNGAIIGMSRSEVSRKFDEIVEFSGISQFIDTPVKHYSSGMYTRLAFSVSAHLDPEIMLVDEVLAVGDMAFQRRCIDRMSQARKEGRTILFVSHGMASVNKLCSRAILLEKGRCKFEGDAREVTEQYIVDNTPMEDVASGPEFLIPSDDQYGIAQGLRLSVRSVSGEPRNQFQVGEAWEVGFVFEMRSLRKEVVAAVGLVSRDGTPICTIWSKPTSLSPGVYQGLFRFDLPLSVCTLDLVVGISCETGVIFYSEKTGGLVKILPNTGKDGHVRSSGILWSDASPEIMQATL